MLLETGIVINVHIRVTGVNLESPQRSPGAKGVRGVPESAFPEELLPCQGSGRVVLSV